MSDDQPGSSPNSRSWLERLSQAFQAEPRDREQLVDLLRDAERRGLVDAEALAIMEGALNVSRMQVRDIMIPRAQMAVVERDARPEEFVNKVIDSGHSRFPVIGDSRDEVVGILLAKDLLGYFASENGAAFKMREVLRPAVFIPESKRLNVLLPDFRASRNHMAIVVDEYGGVAGLVTIEDVLEQIVGEISDEHDAVEGGYIKRIGRGEYTVKALTPIEDFNEYFSTRFSDEEFDTIGGLVVKAFGYVPRRDETRVIDGIHFRVLRADKRRLHLLRVSGIEDVGEHERERSDVETDSSRAS
ncbi:MAG: CBS domain-containing protein [Gammaproteobacteria bacterium]|nr:CBS domain-containing protein [Gammaproteobacteria bacterium]NIR84085.1 CBS domain-containing protein [Gammaproteobacteria bacterium]NIR89229.1 CBS domain-containing protein [Gammaproteobacteria bacterium]NIU05031.1 CBS domain-containing protein [Gammaproteobacteria bacterium]NIV52197.1 CBS domain-containing protein [Gammaproteobacteria bacterium]